MLLLGTLAHIMSTLKLGTPVLIVTKVSELKKQNKKLTNDNVCKAKLCFENSLGFYSAFRQSS